MARKHETYTLEVEAGFSTEYYPSHIEEGHGFHELGNYTTLEVDNIILKLANGREIDITDQLNEETKDAIFKEIADDL